MVFLADYYDVEAFDATTGSLIWSVGLQHVVYGVTAYHGQIFAPTDVERFTALRASDGMIVWSKFYDAGDVMQAPAAAHGRLFSLVPYRLVFSIEAPTGDVAWSDRVSGYYGDSPAEANGVIYVGGHDAFLYAFDETSGEVLATLPADSALSLPAVAGGMVFVTSDSGTLYAFGLAS